MKFTNGCWLKQKGMECFSPAEAYEVSYDKHSKEIRIYAPSNKIYNRGCTLGGVSITLRIGVALPGVFRIRLSHFEGRNGHELTYILRESKEELDYTIGDGIEIRSDGAVLKVSPEMNITLIQDGNVVTTILSKDMMYVRANGFGDAYITNEDVNYMSAGTNLSVGESIYGLGEQFGPFIKNGQSVAMWNEDGGTSTDQSYKCVPFYISSRGYGVFVNHPERVEYEVGSEQVKKVLFSVPGEKLEFFMICGQGEENDRLKDVISKYTLLTGRPPIVPEWSFGLWLSTSFTTDYNEETVMSFINGMLDRGLPISVFHFDCFWMKGTTWCSFLWDEEAFPDPKGMLQRIRKKGIKVCLWINPYIAQNSELFIEGKEKSYFILKENGDVWQWDMWQSGMAIVDFTNPMARTWYQEKLSTLIDMGVDCFKTDFGERIPSEGVCYYNGADPKAMHNYYSYLYNEAVSELVPIVFARSATAGGQKFPVHWGGDCTADFESMAESLRGGLSLSMCGFGYWSHDIGGFEDTSTPDVYKRWVAFGLLSSHSRMHGSTSYRVPWNYDEEAVEVTRIFIELKKRLIPYLNECAKEVNALGLPMMRSMVLEFPRDITCAYLDRQYMLGSEIIVAPIMNQEGNAQVYLPAGQWYDYFNQTNYTGERWVSFENVPYTQIPLFVKADSMNVLLSS